MPSARSLGWLLDGRAAGERSRFLIPFACKSSRRRVRPSAAGYSCTTPGVPSPCTDQGWSVAAADVLSLNNIGPNSNVSNQLLRFYPAVRPHHRRVPRALRPGAHLRLHQGPRSLAGSPNTCRQAQAGGRRQEAGVPSARPSDAFIEDASYY